MGASSCVIRDPIEELAPMWRSCGYWGCRVTRSSTHIAGRVSPVK